MGGDNAPLYGVDALTDSGSARSDGGGAAVHKGHLNLPKGQVSSFETQLFSKYITRKAKSIHPQKLQTQNCTIILQEKKTSAPWWLLLSSRVSPFPSKKTSPVSVLVLT